MTVQIKEAQQEAANKTTDNAAFDASAIIAKVAGGEPSEFAKIMAIVNRGRAKAGLAPVDAHIH